MQEIGKRKKKKKRRSYPRCGKKDTEGASETRRCAVIKMIKPWCGNWNSKSASAAFWGPTLSRCHSGCENCYSTCRILAQPSRETFNSTMRISLISKILLQPLTKALSTDQKEKIFDWLNAKRLRATKATPTAGEQQVAISVSLSDCRVLKTGIVCRKNALGHCCALVSHCLSAEEREEPHVYILGFKTHPPHTHTHPPSHLLIGRPSISSRQTGQILLRWCQMCHLTSLEEILSPKQRLG